MKRFQLKDGTVFFYVKLGAEHLSRAISRDLDRREDGGRTFHAFALEEVVVLSTSRTDWVERAAIAERKLADAEAKLARIKAIVELHCDDDYTEAVSNIGELLKD